MKRVVILTILLLMVMPWGEAQAARKALVVGVGAYEHFNDLPTPEEDARVFAETLRQFGFDVQQPQGNRIEDLKGALENFLRSLKGEDEALFYFSGHGIQRQGNNYLFGADSNVDELSSISRVNDHAINVTLLVQEMERRAGLAVLFLDSCRTIQLPRTKGPLGDVKGFTFEKVEIEQDASFIGLAAQENRSAFTGEGTVSFYTEALVAALNDNFWASEPLPQLHSHVRAQVRDATQKAQIPDYRNKLGNREFRFARQTNPEPLVAREQTQHARQEPVRQARDDSNRQLTEGRISTDRLVASLKPANKSMVVLNDVPLRSLPSIAADLAGEVQQGQVIRVLAQVADWYQIQMNTNIAYLQADYLLELKPMAKTVITTHAAVLRRSPTLAANLAGEVGEGQEIRLLAQVEGWYQVRVGKDLAYLQTDYLHEWEAEAERRTRERTPGRRFRDCPECPEMVVIPEGEFIMGGDTPRRLEYPPHRVTIPEPIAVGIYEVTREEFGYFVAQARYSVGTFCSGDSADGWRAPGYQQGDRDPVVCVKWSEAQAYVSWLSKKTGKVYRLLSEAEWEYAARAGTTTYYHWGNEVGQNLANCDGCGSQWDDKMTAPVGSFSPNGFGLYDVHGNVSEWAQDCGERVIFDGEIHHKEDGYEGAPSDGTAWIRGGRDCRKRATRGGSFRDITIFARSAVRSHPTADRAYHDTGIRVARELD